MMEIEHKHIHTHKVKDHILHVYNIYQPIHKILCSFSENVYKTKCLTALAVSLTVSINKLKTRLNVLCGIA